MNEPADEQVQRAQMRKSLRSLRQGIRTVAHDCVERAELGDEEIGDDKRWWEEAGQQLLGLLSNADMRTLDACLGGRDGDSPDEKPRDRCQHCRMEFDPGDKCSARTTRIRGGLPCEVADPIVSPDEHNDPNGRNACLKETIAMDRCRLEDGHEPPCHLWQAGGGPAGGSPPEDPRCGEWLKTGPSDPSRPYKNKLRCRLNIDEHEGRGHDFGQTDPEVIGKQPDNSGPVTAETPEGFVRLGRMLIRPEAIMGIYDESVFDGDSGNVLLARCTIEALGDRYLLEDISGADAEKMLLAPIRTFKHVEEMVAAEKGLREEIAGLATQMAEIADRARDEARGFAEGLRSDARNINVRVVD